MKFSTLRLIVLILMSPFFGILGQLKSGPMLGYSDLKEVMIWVQTEAEKEVKIRYWEIDEPENVKTSNPIITQAKDNFTAHLLANQVDPGKKYAYEISDHKRDYG